MVLANDVLEFVRFRIRTAYNLGYSNEQERRRNRLMEAVLQDLQAQFPEIADKLSVEEFHGYSDYSDFKVCYDKIAFILATTHSWNIHKAFYKAEWWGVKEVSDILDLETCSIEDLCQERNAEIRALKLKDTISKLLRTIEILEEFDIDTTGLKDEVNNILSKEKHQVQTYLTRNGIKIR